MPTAAKTFQAFRQYLSQFGHLTDAEFEHICQLAKFQKVRKGVHFLKEDTICRQIGFILSGVMRTGSYAGDREMTCYFMKENQFTGGFESMMSGRTSDYFVQALTPCELMVFSKDNFEKMLREVPKVQAWSAAILTHELSDKVNQRASLNNMLEAKDIYERFEKEHPDILLRVPLTYVASYLGITPQSFSRLRRERQKP